MTIGAIAKLTVQPGKNAHVETIFGRLADASKQQ